MYWELHDNEEGNSLTAGLKNVACDYGYQYEEKVKDIWADYPWCVEIRCFFERAGDIGGKGEPFRVLKRGDKW